MTLLCTHAGTPLWTRIPARPLVNEGDGLLACASCGREVVPLPLDSLGFARRLLVAA